MAHVIIDGAIDTPWIRENFPQIAESGKMMLAPDEIAETYWQLHRQPRSVWSFELDVRPVDERF